MKLYKKSDLTFKNGMLVDGEGNVVAPIPAIAKMANELETCLQKAEYAKGMPEVAEAPAPFHRKSIGDELPVKEFTCETPLMDKRVEDTLALMDEIDTASTCDKINEVMRTRYAELLQWAADDAVVGTEGTLVLFDTPTMGNPLEWTAENVQDFIALSFGLDIVGDVTEE